MLAPHRLIPLALLVLLDAACEDGFKGVTRVVGYERDVVADDGHALTAFDLHLEGRPRLQPPRAWLFYMVGSEPVSIVGTMEQFADLIARGMTVVLLEPSGGAGRRP